MFPHFICLLFVTVSGSTVDHEHHRVKIMNQPELNKDPLTLSRGTKVQSTTPVIANIVNKWDMFTVVTVNQYRSLLSIKVPHGSCRWICTSISTTFSNGQFCAFLWTDKDLQLWTESEQDQLRHTRWNISLNNIFNIRKRGRGVWMTEKYTFSSSTISVQNKLLRLFCQFKRMCLRCIFCVQKKQFKNKT